MTRCFFFLLQSTFHVAMLSLLHCFFHRSRYNVWGGENRNRSVSCFRLGRTGEGSMKRTRRHGTFFRLRRTMCMTFHGARISPLFPCMRLSFSYAITGFNDGYSSLHGDHLLGIIAKEVVTLHLFCFASSMERMGSPGGNSVRVLQYGNGRCGCPTPLLWRR